MSRFEAGSILCPVDLGPASSAVLVLPENASPFARTAREERDDKRT